MVISFSARIAIGFLQDLGEKLNLFFNRDILVYPHEFQQPVADSGIWIPGSDFGLQCHQSQLFNVCLDLFHFGDLQSRHLALKSLRNPTSGHLIPDKSEKQIRISGSNW